MSALDEILEDCYADLIAELTKNANGQVVKAHKELRRLRESDSIVEYMDEKAREEGFGMTTARQQILDEMESEGYTQGEDGRWTQNLKDVKDEGKDSKQ